MEGATSPQMENTGGHKLASPKFFTDINIYS